MDEYLRYQLLQTLRENPDHYFDCFTLSLYLGADCHQTALTLADIEREYQLDHKVEQFPFDYERRRFDGTLERETIFRPVTLIRFGRGLTWHESRKQGDNRSPDYVSLLKIRHQY